MYDREDEILNYFVNRSTNASAESLNAKIKDFCLLTHQMFDSCNWMVDNHSWSRPSHYNSDTLFHLWPIAMHRAFLACGLLLAKTASVESALGIVQQCLAAWAKCSISFIFPAIQTYHLLHHRLFFFNASVIHCFIHLFHTSFQAFLCRSLCGRCSCGQHVWH